jgi:hypothetical protein
VLEYILVYFGGDADLNERWWNFTIHFYLILLLRRPYQPGVEEEEKTLQTAHLDSARSAKIKYNGYSGESKSVIEIN